MNSLALICLGVCLSFAGLEGFPQRRGEQPLILSPDRHERIVSQHIQFLRDPTGQVALSEVLSGAAGTFRDLPARKIDFGFTPDTIWLKLPVINGGDRTGSWLLATNTGFMNRLEAWLVTEGSAQLIVTDSEKAPFDAREISYRHVTGRFRLAAGDQAAIVISYRSRGTTSLPLSIETNESFADRRVFESVKNSVFFTGVAAMIFFGLAFMPIMRWRVHLAYAAYLSWVVFYVAQIDGYTFQFFWPNSPEWNAYASLPLGYGLAIFAAIFAREVLGTRTSGSRLDLLLRGVIWTTAAMVLSSLIIDTQWLKKFGFLYICLISLLVTGFAICTRYRHRTGFWCFIAGWLAVVASAVFSTLAHWNPGALPVDASFDTIRAGILIQGLMFAFAMSVQLRTVQHERDDAIRRQMAVLRQKLALEHSHAYALALADARQAQLAGASHDLKQPLLSLKLMLRRAIDSKDGTALRAMRQAIDYLDGLVRRYLDEARASAPPAKDRPEDIPPDTFEASLILENVAAMFADEAEARGGRLRLVSSTARLQGDPMPVMRIVSNFVSNAVKHSGKGEVLLGCRRQGEAIRIEVHDRGPGLDGECLSELRRAHETGRPDELDSRDGYGLIIALRLIAEHGHGFDVRVSRGRGTVFAVVLKCARSPDQRAVLGLT